MLGKSKYTWVFIVIAIILVNVLYESDEKNNILRLEWIYTLPLSNDDNPNIINNKDLLYDLSIENKLDKKYSYIQQKVSSEDIVYNKLIKIDENGNIINHNIIDIFSNKNEVFKINKIITDYESYVLLENSSYDLPVDFSVKKIDKNNIEQWSKTFKSDGSIIIMTNIVSMGNDYIISGYKYDDIENGKSKFCAYKLNKDGTLIWKIEHGLSDNLMLNNIFVDSDNNLIVSGTIYRGAFIDIWLASINSEGQIKWEKQLKDCSILGQSDVLKNDSFAVMLKSNKSLSKNKYRMLSFDLQGNIKWEKIYTFPFDYQNLGLYNDKESYIVFSNYEKNKRNDAETQSEEYCHITNIDQNGKVKWEENIAKLNNKKIQDITIYDNQYLLTGTMKDIKDMDVPWVGKFIKRKYILR
ncbi:MAG TPA: hypothetical protein DEP72_06640 [Clostridiales bacterium]|nr:MAG: hypothetical protein A2Y18_02615 [Clostridiales bacterium GWD2_32_19]HCC07816.1 hypothetical protein [Clostridiales bacterium]